MILFDTESQYREKATIWRVLSVLPLYAPLADGHIWRWFAVNIPMTLGTGGQSDFESDIDILARLSNYPRSDDHFYRAWEVKVSLICQDGACRSLKAGRKKTAKLGGQLRTYRKFGCPYISLLDVYVCQAGYFEKNHFPPGEMASAVQERFWELHEERFGYQVLPFEYDTSDGFDCGPLRSLNLPKPSFQGPPFQTTIPLLRPVTHEPHQPFSRLAARPDDFFEKHWGKPNQQIIYCRGCRCLQLICMREGDFLCPECQENLICQS